MRIDSEGLERLGFGPLLSTLVPLWVERRLHHTDRGCKHVFHDPEVVELPLGVVYDFDICRCVRMLQGAPAPFLELTAAQALSNVVTASGPAPVLGISPRDVSRAASRLVRVEKALEDLSLLSPTPGLVMEVYSRVFSAFEVERDALVELCRTARSAALVQVAARAAVDELVDDSGSSASQVALNAVAPWWQDHVVDGLDAPERRRLVAERLCSARPVLEEAALDELDALLAELLAEPDVLAVVHLPVRPPGEGLFRLVVDSTTVAGEGRLRLLQLPAFALGYLAGFRSTEVRSVASAPSDPVVLENAVSMWSPDPGPLSEADKLVSAAAAVQR